jgi:hypothetical protein
MPNRNLRKSNALNPACPEAEVAKEYSKNRWNMPLIFPNIDFLNMDKKILCMNCFMIFWNIFPYNIISVQ